MACKKREREREKNKQTWNEKHSRIEVNILYLQPKKLGKNLIIIVGSEKYIYLTIIRRRRS